MKILLTGATGFIGQSLLKALTQHEVIVFGRSKPKVASDFRFVKGDLNESFDISHTLSGVDVVVYCAARAHVMNETEQDPLLAYRKTNTLAAILLAKQAEQAGVKRFVYLSSIKVNGESTLPGQKFKASDVPMPIDPYGVSKLEAEIGLRELSNSTQLDVVIIRPPLVYGVGVKANFKLMVALAKTPLPLPFGGMTDNRRSLVFIDNLVDLIVVCLDHPNARNQVFVVSDDNDLSTAEMFTKLRFTLGKKPGLFSLPKWFFLLLGRIPFVAKMLSRLDGSLRVDIKSTKNRLNWLPPHTVEKAFDNTLK